MTHYDRLLRHRHAGGDPRGRRRRHDRRLPRRRSLSEQAATTAIDTACGLLRLPSIRNEFAEIADRAVKDQMTYRDFLAELLMTYCGFLAELLMAECHNRAWRCSERAAPAPEPPRQVAADLRLRCRPQRRPGRD